LQTSYITSAQKAHQLPAYDWPEVAFIGRSNCGKSSLLNALLGRTKLARESSTPGRTQMVNFFNVQKGDKQVILADLPGYGYSATGREVRQHWDELLTAYFARRNIERFLFLMDGRRALTTTGMDDDDQTVLRHLGRRKDVPLTVVLTKADKMNQAEGAKARAAVAAQLQAWKIRCEELVLVSSLKKKGLADVQRRVVASLGE
jgi:GTP-binding protein